MENEWVVLTGENNAEVAGLKGEDKPQIPKFVFDDFEQANMFVERAIALEEASLEAIDFPEWDEKYEDKYEERNFFAEPFGTVLNKYEIRPWSEVPEAKDFVLIRMPNGDKVSLYVVHTVVSISEYDPETKEMARVLISSGIDTLVEGQKFDSAAKQKAYERILEDPLNNYCVFMRNSMDGFIPAAAVGEDEESAELLNSALKNTVMEHILTFDPSNVDFREKNVLWTKDSPGVEAVV